MKTKNKKDIEKAKAMEWNEQIHLGEKELLHKEKLNEQELKENFQKILNYIKKEKGEK